MPRLLLITAASACAGCILSREVRRYEPLFEFLCGKAGRQGCGFGRLFAQKAEMIQQHTLFSLIPGLYSPTAVPKW